MESRENTRNIKTSCSSRRTASLNSRGPTAAAGTPHRESREGTAASTSLGFISGERVSGSACRGISALYRAKFHKYPTFPSIYESKYQHDFKHVPFPQSRAYEPTNQRSDYSKFQIGSSSYNEQFNGPKMNSLNHATIKPLHATPRHNPQPRMKVIFNNPNEPKWIWNSLERCNTTGKGGEAVGHRGYAAGWKYHRWNSR